MRTLRMTVLIGTMAITFSSCHTTKVRTVHVPLKLLENCVFEKYTEKEKAYLRVQEGQTIGKKIRRNQLRCKNIYDKNKQLVAKHNDLLGKDL